MSSWVSIVLLAVHLLAVDLAMMGPLACVWIEWQATRRGDAAGQAAARTLAALSLLAFGIGIALGGLLLALRWQSDADYFQAVAILPRSRLWFALAELIFFAVCMGGYLAFWIPLARYRFVHRAIAVAAALNLLVHFPALFAIVSVARGRPQLWGDVLDRAGYWRLLLDGAVASRVLHVWLSAAVVAGVVVMLLGRRQTSNPPAASGLVQRGAWLALGAAMLQIPVGVWTTIELPDHRQQQLIGGSLLATSLFVTSLLLAMLLMHTLASIALGELQGRLVLRSSAIMCMLVLAMTATRGVWPERAAADRDQHTQHATKRTHATSFPIGTLSARALP